LQLTVQAAAYFTFYFIAHFSKKVKSGILMDFFVFSSGLFKTGDFLVGSDYINTEDNYERLIDFLSQISKLFNFNVLDLADFMLHHWFPVCFFVLIQSHTITVAHLYLQYVSFRASPSVGSSGGL